LKYLQYIQKSLSEKFTFNEDHKDSNLYQNHYRFYLNCCLVIIYLLNCVVLYLNTRFRGLDAAVIAADSLMLSKVSKSLAKQVNPHLEVIQVKYKYLIQRSFPSCTLLSQCSQC